MRSIPALKPLRFRDFRLLWSGLAISLIGDGLWLIALAWQVIELDGGPAQLSLVASLYSVGLLAFVLPAGVLADRVSRRAVMLSADLGRAIVVTAVGALSLGGAIELWHLAVGGFLIGVGEAFFVPSYTAILPRLLPEEELLAANGLEGMLRPLAQQAIGPALGGLAVAAFSPGAAILSCCATYLFSAACLTLIRTSTAPDRGGTTEESADALTDLREGWRYVRATPWLWATLLFALIAILFIIGPLEVLGPFAVRDRAGGESAEYGLLLACYGIGSALGALVISSRPMPRRYLTVMLLAWGAGSLPVAALGLATTLWIMCAGIFLVGATGAVGNVIWGTLLQRRVPDGLRGRVSALDWFVSLGLLPVSMALAGPAGDAFGLTAVFIAAGVAPVLAAAWAFRLGRLGEDELAHPLR